MSEFIYKKDILLNGFKIWEIIFRWYKSLVSLTYKYEIISHTWISLALLEEWKDYNEAFNIYKNLIINLEEKWTNN